VVAWPKPIVRADFTTPELQIPTDWTDLSSRVRGTNIHQGRSRLLGQTETGNATVLMNNLDRGLDPTLHPEVKPGVHLQIQTVVGTQTIDLFRGYVRSWGQEWPGKKDAITPVTAEDAFSLLARYELQGDAIGEMTTGDHLAAVLALYGWPAPGSIPPGSTWWRLGTVGFSELGTSTFLGEQAQQFDTGQATIMATTLEGNLLTHLLNVAEKTEGGTFYVGPSGDLIFKQRPSISEPSIGTWGDGEGEFHYTELMMDYDDDELYNDIRVTRRGDTVASMASDVPALTAPRTLPLTDVLFSTLGQAQDLADTLLSRYKQPMLHPMRMVMRPPYDSPLWLATLGVELGSKITVRRRPPGGGAMIELDCFILGVTLDITPSFWEITWDLAPAEEFIDGFWYLGVTGRSELGTTTVLA
jgi:hypothetical protein